MKACIEKAAVYFGCILVGYKVYNHGHYIGYEVV